MLVTAGLRFLTHQLQSRKGKILLFDFSKPDAVEELDIVWKNEARFFDDQFSPHGIDVFTTKKGKTIVFVVNHSPHEAIERFELNLQKKTLTHLESIQDPAMRLMNSVVAMGERSFFFSNYLYWHGGVLGKLEVYLDLRFGSVGSYDGKTSTGMVLKKGYGLANGLALSRDRTKLYMVNIADMAVDTFLVHSVTNITWVSSLVLDTVADNIQVDPDDGSLWLGCHPAPTQTVKYLDSPETSPVPPSQVLNVKVDKQGIPADDVTEVYSNRGSQIAASTVALRHKNKLLIGSVCQNTVVCEIRNQ